MKTYYDYYRLGCQEAGIPPASPWRFQVAYSKYKREFRKALDERVDLLPAKQRERIVARWARLVRLAELVERGREIAERASWFPRDDEPGTAGAGTREPRIPLTPVLSGSAARPLPTENSLKETYHWRF